MNRTVKAALGVGLAGAAVITLVIFSGLGGAPDGDDPFPTERVDPDRRVSQLCQTIKHEGPKALAALKELELVRPRPVGVAYTLVHAMGSKESEIAKAASRVAENFVLSERVADDFIDQESQLEKLVQSGKGDVSTTADAMLAVLYRTKAYQRRMEARAKEQARKQAAEAEQFARRQAAEAAQAAAADAKAKRTEEFVKLLDELDKPLEVVDIRLKKQSETEFLTEFAWEVQVKNRFRMPVTCNFQVNFLDSSGLMLDYVFRFRQRIEAYSTATFNGLHPLRPSKGSRVDSITFAPSDIRALKR